MIERQGNEVRVTGAVTIANAAAVAEAGKQELNADITFDLAGVTEVDSTALSVLFEWQRAAKQKSSVQSLASLYGVADLVAA
jgi:phospholipid transport system transporter-binding protein